MGLVLRASAPSGLAAIVEIRNELIQIIPERALRAHLLCRFCAMLTLTSTPTLLLLYINISELADLISRSAHLSGATRTSFWNWMRCMLTRCLSAISTLVLIWWISCLPLEGV